MWLLLMVFAFTPQGFLLTHPVWDVTFAGTVIICSILISTHTSRVGCDACGSCIPPYMYHFYSHIPCGMWLARSGLVVLGFLISTHTSRVGCDDITLRKNLNPVNFYSHIPCGMWLNSGIRHQSDRISTHTSRVGCDAYNVRFHALFIYFYSHIPCGMWRLRRGLDNDRTDFYSHIPCGMWLSVRRIAFSFSLISTHTSRVGCDRYI